MTFSRGDSSMQRKLSSSTGCLVILSLLLWAHTASAAGVKLPAAYLYKKGKVQCGFVGSAWESGVKKKNLFYSYKATIAELTKKAKKQKGSTKAATLKQIKTLKTKRSTDNKKVCSKVARPDRVNTLRDIPNTKSFVREKTSGAATAAAVIGVPPALPTIPSMSAKEIFWSPGVIDSLAADSTQYCSEFWVGQQDAESGGMLACSMTEGLGYTFSPVAQSQVNLCYMKNIFTPEHVASGAVQVLSGSPPDGDILALFSPPTGSADRLVRLQFGEGSRNYFIKVYSGPNNAANNYQYRADMWTCWSGKPTADRLQVLSVNRNQLFRLDWKDTEGENAGGYAFTLLAPLTVDADGNKIFDNTQPRTEDLAYQHPANAFAFKSSITIEPENRILSKSYRTFASGTARKDFVVTGFSGATLDELRFLAGAFKSIDVMPPLGNFNNQGGTEFRDPRYVAAPGTDLLALLASEDLTTDPFFAETPSVSIDLSAYSCAAQADVAMKVQVGLPELATVIAGCDANAFSEFNFCSSNADITAAKNKWFQNCVAG